MTEKVYVLDTSVLMHDPAAIENLGDNIIVVPIWVIEELDHLKKVPGKGEIARRASRKLDAYRQQGSLKTGVPTQSHGTIFIDYAGTDFSVLPVHLEETNDNRVIAVAYQWKEEHSQSSVVLISKDVNLRIKADALGINAEDYLYDKKIQSPDELYTGIAELELQGDVTELLNLFFNKEIVPDELVFAAMSSPRDLTPNQCCYLTAGSTTGLAIYKKRQGIFRRVTKPKAREKSEREILPINAEQAFALALLQDPDIALVTLAGKAGTGKTLIASLGGWGQIPEYYRQLVIYRPNIEVGRPLGYLPGTLDEKFAPWMQPIYDNLDLIVRGPQQEPAHNAHRGGFKRRDAAQEKGEPSFEDLMEGFMEHGLLEISPINFVQGRTLHHRFVIVDEAQNLTPSETKVVITRMGEGSKVVLTGDPEQIVNPFLDAVSNGLTHVIENMKNQELCGHITMKKTERSRLAELAADLL